MLSDNEIAQHSTPEGRDEGDNGEAEDIEPGSRRCGRAFDGEQEGGGQVGCPQQGVAAEIHPTPEGLRRRRHWPATRPRIRERAVQSTARE